MSLSLALGILVGDLGGYELLTRAHAQGTTCGGTRAISSPVTIIAGIADGGIVVRDVLVNGELVAQGVIADSVRIVGGGIVRANGVFVGGDGGTATGARGGVFVGGDEGSPSACANGVFVGGDGGTGARTTGVFVGGDDGSNEVRLGGATVSSSGAAIGGTLTGDNITVTDGVITGQNLLLSGTIIDGGSAGGTFTSVQITPVN
jgi:hypothetical protein